MNTPVHDVVFDRIREELHYAIEKWGNDFDDKNTLNDWVTYVCMYATKAAEIGRTEQEQHDYLIKAAGLAVSALVTMIRNGGFAPRHYDSES